MQIVTLVAARLERGLLDARRGLASALSIPLACALVLTGCLEGGGGETTTTTTTRPQSVTCVAQARPVTATGSVRVERTFANERFRDSLALVQHPTLDDRWYVVRKSGTVDTFLESNPAGTRSQAVAVNVVTDIEMGLLGMAFHPDFARNGLVFLSYTRAGGTGVGVSVIARYISSNNGLTFQPDGSDFEILTLDQPAGNHNGGGIAFGPDDGFLYAAFGDGGPGRSTFEHSQGLDNLYGTIIRIDVDDEPYSSPPDNPFVGRAGMDEIWAYGFRNPWRFSFDMLTGDLWIGDVGQRTFEEIDRIPALDNSGGNFGWPIKEGNACYQGSSCQGRTDLIDPVYTYGRDMGASVTGGYVYRGTELAGLQGTYIYGDYAGGPIYSLSGILGNNPSATLLTQMNGQLVSFGQARDGELYGIDLGGRIFRLVADGPGPVANNFPTLLSDTGCFEPSDPSEPVSGVIPYEVAVPFWSDGATKERFMSVPGNASISVASDGHFDFPTGTVLAKTFRLGSRLVETRLFMRHDDGEWGGYSYEWNAAGTDATLLDATKRVNLGGVDWLFPGRSDCFRCHTSVAGRSLGPEVAQLNFPIRHPDGTTENQVDRLVASGVIAGGVPNLAPEYALMPAIDDASADVETRARAYLHTNCAYCHQPGGPGSGDSDLRFQTPLASARICDDVPTRGDLGVAGARLVFPREPLLSVLHLRMVDTGVDRMPDYGSDLIDVAAVSVVRDWISDLNACP